MTWGEPRFGSETGTGGPVIEAECPYCHRQISLYKRKAHPGRKYRGTAGIFFFMHNIAPHVRCLGSKREYKGVTVIDGKPQNIGDLARIAREHRGLTQRELAAKAGLAQSTICELEVPNRRQVPNIHTFLHVMQTLDFAVDVTITPKEDKPQSWNYHSEKYD